MSTPRVIPPLLAHVQRGRMPAVTAGPTRKDIRAPRPRPALDEVVFDVPLELIVANSPIQTRDPFDPDASDEDAALLDVVRQGLWTPPVVVRAVDVQPGDRASTYQIEDGHRRVAAHRLAGRLTVRAVITRHDGREADLTTLRANTFKRLPPVQQAQAIARVRERHGLEYQTIAELAGLTPRYVSELMRMLDAGAGALQAVEEGRLSVHEAARLGRSVRAELEGVENASTAWIGVADPSSTLSHGPAASAAIMALPSKTKVMPVKASQRTLQDDLEALSWLNAEQTIQLMAWARQDSIRFNQVLATALLLGVNQHLAIQDAAGLAMELLQGRVGVGIVQMMAIGLRLKRAADKGETSPEERTFIRTVASWLLAISGESMPIDFEFQESPTA